MDRVKLFMSLVFMALISKHLYADRIPSRIERRFNAAVYQLLGDYERNHTLSSPNRTEEFKALFISDTVKVFNDLIGLSTQPYLTVDEYIRVLSEKSKRGTRKVSIKNVRKHPVTDGDLVWYMKLSMEKNIEYIDNDDVILDAAEYYKADYEITITFCYNKEERKCCISHIDGRITSDVPTFPEEYRIVQQETTEKNKKIQNVKYQGHPLHFDRHHQAILNTANTEDLSYPDVDVHPVWKAQTQGGRKVEIQFKRNHFRFRPKVEFALDKLYNFTDSRIPDLQLKSSDVVVGADIGYVFPSKNKVKWGFYTGAALSRSRINLTMDEMDYYYKASRSQDVDGDQYYRHYELSNIKQVITNMCAVIPLYLDVEKLWTKYFTTYLDLGGKVYLKLDSKVESGMNAYIYGIYPDYGNLKLDLNTLNGFGHKWLGTANQAYDELWVIASYDLFAEAGFRVYLNRKQTIAFSAGLQYLNGVFRDSYIALGYTDLSNESANTKLVSYRPGEGEKVRLLTDNYPGQHHRHASTRLNIGFIFKF